MAEPRHRSGSDIGAIALAGMDNDGDVEIVAGNQLFDHLGNLLWTAPQIAGANSATPPTRSLGERRPTVRPECRARELTA